MSYKEKLQAGLSHFAIDYSDEQLELLLAYHQLLIKWNKAYNLTAVRDPEVMVEKHLLDCLSIIPHIPVAEDNSFNCIDVGTGPGLPGLLLAIMRPAWRVDLLDSNGKKTRFLFQAKTELGLGNIAIYNCRAKDLLHDGQYQGIFSRAFATLQDMIEHSEHLLANEGYFYAMKGLYPEQELSAIQKPYMVDDCQRLNIPGVDAERHLIRIARV